MTAEIGLVTEVFDETGASLVQRIETFTEACSAVFGHPATALLGVSFIAQCCLAGLGARRQEAEEKFEANAMAARLN